MRCSVALASLLGRAIRVVNIRASRDKPGLRPQHLKAIEACQQMCRARVTNARVGSREITYEPRERFQGGQYSWDIGTAGSATMMAQTLLPLACFAREKSVFRLEGGLFQDFAPSAYHMKHVLLPLLERMGVRAELDIIRPGYVPRGGGIIELRVEPAGEFRSLEHIDQGRVMAVGGWALSSHLKEKGVSERMAAECSRVLGAHGYRAQIELIEDDTSLQPGAVLAVYAETDLRNRIGSDRAGRPGRSSESIGRHVAEHLVQDLASGAAVDRFTADQLIMYAGLARGTSRCSVPRISDHVEANLWLIGELLGVEARVAGNLVEIEGLGFA